MPIGSPFQNVPKSGCRNFVEPMKLTYAAELGSMGYPEMSVFHGLSGGKTVQLVDTPVGVAVGRGDAVGAGRGVGVGTTCVGVGGTADGVAVGFGERVGVGVSVGFGVRVGVGVRVGLRVGVGVGGRVGVGVGITDTSAATSPPAKSNTMPDAIPAARPREILMRRSRASLIPRSRPGGLCKIPDSAGGATPAVPKSVTGSVGFSPRPSLSPAR